ncbi:MFS superfamily sulfate permease-like transporter [Paucibacter oligotrophus]|uniref:MFS superfamily sulfate permease-like transporter n=1 Tax=Roseateles oligotrophus TaxID=1769250 RepID=A0A840LCX2_9BURK|nr:SulP family inorganic anion transporter [Roseateles oligotrophus]MBB4844533.1 MFS superfamily sulfate permease-like transporter [Roseateles oligotrophus]
MFGLFDNLPQRAVVPRPVRAGDWVAGLCVAGILLPEAVAYAGLARLPVGYALTAMLVGLAVYALFGGSRFAIVSPTSSTATLSAAAVLSLPGAGAGLFYGQALLALVLLAGALLCLLAWGRQGALSAFVSRPVLRGFAFALALSIVIKQLPDALGLALPPEVAHEPLPLLLYALGHPQLWHGPSVAVALLAGLCIGCLRRWPRVPAAMVAIVLAIAAAALLDLAGHGVAEVGALPPLRFAPGWPQLPLADWLQLAELAFGLVVLIFAESWGSMRTLALAHGDRLDPNRELLVLGACNLASGLLQGMPVGAGFSASAANAAAGALSRAAGAVALGVIVLVLLLALPALHLLPRPVLAVAVIGALAHALHPKPLLALWRMNRDRLLLLGAIAAVLLLGVLHGMLAAIALSLVAALKRFSQPVVHELGELGQSRNFVVINNGNGAQAVPGLLVLRPEEPLFFASAERVVADVLAQVAQRPGLQCLVLSLEESSDLDSTAVECLQELAQRLRESGQTLLLSRVKERVRELLQAWDPQGLGAPERMFWSVADAVQASRSLRT